jgi:MOSC domain-containing protein YiiM
MESIKELQNHYSQAGKVVYIGVRPVRLEPVKALNQVLAVADQGLEADRYRNKGARQVTLIQAEHLQAISSFMGKPITPDLVRRNLVIEGLNLSALKGKRFTIGNAILEYSGECHPCSRMEINLGVGGYNAMRGHGGITAKVISGGLIKLGDAVQVIRFS